jgi:hypothetical protein
MLTRLNDNSKFYIEENQWENNVFDSDVSTEGTKDNQVQEGNDNVNMEEEEDEIINQDVQDKEPIVIRSGRITAYLEDHVLSAMSYGDDNPQSYSETEGRRDRTKWRKSIKRRARKQNLEHNRTT